jgi:putative phosphoribosyl transferase
MRFRNRREAGQRLAKLLATYANRPDVLVLGLPRGGVPVAFVVAQSLHVPLDVMIVRKLGSPGQEELAMGAVATGGIRVLNDDVIRCAGVSPEDLQTATVREQREVTRRALVYRGGRPLPDIHGRTVILVDDGIATGATIRAAIAAIRAQKPVRLIVAAPVAAVETCDTLRSEVDDLVVAYEPDVFFGVGLWYDDFPQITDDAVCALLAQAWDAEALQVQAKASSHTPYPGDCCHRRNRMASNAR